MHNRLIYFCIVLFLISLSVACSGEYKTTSATSAVAKTSVDSIRNQQALLHNGTSDTIKEIITHIYSAKQIGDTIIKAGKPELDREFSAFPNEDTCTYDTTGKIETSKGRTDGIPYKYVYGYENGLLNEVLYYQNGELFSDIKYIYDQGRRINTIEELYIAGSKTINEYPVDQAKVGYINGNRIEYGETPNDYTITDMRGNVIKESSYSEMDDYCSVIEYSYNDRGWRISINCESEYLYTYDYANIDTHGNWTRAIIRCNGTPYGIVERAISYY